MKNTTPFAILIAALILAGTTTDAAAKRVYRERGFYLGANFAGSFIDITNKPGSLLIIDENGGMLELKAGYSFNPVFSLELSIAGANHETTDPAINMEFGAVRLFGHYRFRPSHQLRPYVKGGFGGYGLRLDAGSVSNEFSGGGLAFGGGLDYFFTRHFSLGLDYTFNLIEYTDATLNLQNISVTSDIDEDSAQSALGLAFSFYF